MRKSSLLSPAMKAKRKRSKLALTYPKHTNKCGHGRGPFSRVLELYSTLLPDADLRTEACGQRRRDHSFIGKLSADLLQPADTRIPMVKNKTRSTMMLMKTTRSSRKERASKEAKPMRMVSFSL